MPRILSYKEEQEKVKVSGGSNSPIYINQKLKDYNKCGKMVEGKEGTTVQVQHLAQY